MPRKLFRRYLPDGDSVRAHKYLAWLGAWLNHPNLWSLNRDSVAGGVKSVVAGLAVAEPAVAAEWVNRFPEGELRNEAQISVLSHWAKDDPTAAATWLQTLQI